VPADDLDPTDLARIDHEAMAALVQRTRRLGFDARFDAASAIRALHVFERLLVHTKGRWARKRFLLAPWQWHEIICPLFGMQIFDPESETWVRLYRLLWLELGRKNGKSEMLAAIAIILLAADDEEGAEVYGAAKDREQASLVFNVAARMLELAGLAGRGKPFKVYRINKRIVYVSPSTGTTGFYQVIAADAKGNLGQDPHGIIFDEVLAQPDKDLWDALRTGYGSRRQPLMVAATTAGDDPTGFAFAEHEFSAKVAADPALDPRRLVVIYSVPAEIDGRKTDPFDESLWHLGNPALAPEHGKPEHPADGFLSRQVLRDEALTARHKPADLSAFVMFRLNRWQDHQGVSGWLGLDVWDANPRMVVFPQEFAGLEVIGGLDLSATQDTTSLCWIAKDPARSGGYIAAWRFWIPEERVPDLARRTGGAAETWVREGRLTTTPGDVIDYDLVFDAIEEDARRLEVLEIGFDRWGAANLVQRLQKLIGDERVVRVGQGYRDLGPGMREVERLLLAGALRHGQNPVARWQYANVMIRTDEADNRKPDRRRSRDKIDGMVAAIMAVSRWIDRPVPRSRRSAFIS
jgi:phage terminase large subunit-like protein